MSLAGAQEIGGVVVTIGADLSPLRAGVAESKVIAATTERTVKIGLPVMIAAGSEAKLRADLSRLALSLSNSTVIRIPVVLDTSGAMGQLTGGGGFGGGGGNVNGGGGQLMLPGPSSGTTVVGHSFLGGATAVAGGAASAAATWGGGGGDYGQSEWGGLGGLDTGGQSFWTRKMKLRGVKSVLPIFAGIAAAQSLKAMSYAAAAGSTSDPDLQAMYDEKTQQAVQGVPFLGGIASVGADLLYRTASLAWNTVTFQGPESNLGKAEDMQIAAAQQNAKTDRARAVVDAKLAVNKTAKEQAWSVGLANQTIGKSGTESAVIEAKATLARYNEENAGKTGEQEDYRKAMSAHIAVLQHQDDNAKRQAQLDKEDQEYAEYQAAHRDEVNDQFSRTQMKIAGNNQVQLIGSQISMAGRSAQMAGIAGSSAGLWGEASAKLAMEGLRYQNELTAANSVNDQSKASIESKFAEGKQGVEDKYGEGTYESEKRIKELDEERKKQLDALASLTDSIKSEIGARHHATEAEIAFADTLQKKGFGSEMSTRQAVAGAVGKGQGLLAGFIGQIGGMEQERIHTQPNQLGMLEKTQIAELKGMQGQLSLPTQYATQINRGFDAPGGPSGKSGNELPEILKLIAKTIIDLQKDIKALAPAN